MIRRKRQRNEENNNNENSTVNDNGESQQSSNNGQQNDHNVTTGSTSSLWIPVSPSISDDLRSTVLSLFYPSRDRFFPFHYQSLPGPLPASLSRAHLSLLSNTPYWVCEKSDGERAVLFANSRNKSIYIIDRKFQFRQLNSEYSKFYIDLLCSNGDSLLDGELIDNNQLLLFDVLIVNGVRYAEAFLETRLKAIGQQIIVKYRQQSNELTSNGSTPPLSIGSKAFYRSEFVKKKIFDFIKPEKSSNETSTNEFDIHQKYIYDDGKRSNHNDGVIFTPAIDDYYQKNAVLLKWKWPNLNTIDFVIKTPFFDKENRLKLYTLAKTEDNQTHKEITGDTFIRSTTLISRDRKLIKDEIELKNIQRAVIECGYNSNLNCWNIKTIRHDKHAANFITTCLSTVESIIDNVTPQLLEQACQANAKQKYQIEQTHLKTEQQKTTQTPAT